MKAAEDNLVECLGMRRAVGEIDEEVAITLHSLGKVFWQLGNLESAEKSLTESLSMMRRIPPKKCRSEACRYLVADIHTSLGKVFLQREDLEAAQMSLTESLSKKRALYGDGERKEVAMMLHKLGIAVKEKDDTEDADAKDY